MRLGKKHRFGAAPSPSWRRRLLRGAQSALYWTGATRIYENLGAPRSLPILMYHSVAPEADARWIAPRNRMHPAQFEAQMRFLARSRHVMSLDALIDMVRDRQPIPDRAVLLTFDDGYRDNLAVVAPILRQYRLPAVLYLCTGYVTRGQNQWADMLYSAMASRQRDRLTLNGRLQFDLGEPSNCEPAYQTVAARMFSADCEAREQLLNAVVSQLGSEPKPPRQTLVWDEIRELVRDYPEFTVGVHTADHRDLSSVGLEAALAEIRASVDTFEKELDMRPAHFSFPYSRSVPEISQHLVRMGFRSAMTGEGMGPLGELDPLDMRRVPAPPSQTRLRYLSTGAHPGLSMRLLGRA